MLANGMAITYLIDGQNRRVGKKVNGALVESFVYQDQFKRVAWYDGAWTLKAQFIFGARPSVPDFMVKSGTIYRLIADQVGSVRVVTDSTGSVAERADYDEFGNLTLDANPGFIPFGFAAGLIDGDTGLIRFGARDYYPATARWTAPDPIRFDGGDTNLTAYSHSDPINSADPSGLYQIDNDNLKKCPNWDKALASARKRAGCDGGGGDGGGNKTACDCKAKLSECKTCDICSILQPGSGPLAIIESLGRDIGGCTESSWDLRHCPGWGNWSSNWRVQFDTGICVDPARIEDLASVMIHEALHACPSIGGPPIGHGGSCGAETITKACGGR